MTTDAQVFEYLQKNHPALYYLSLAMNELSSNLELRDLGKLFANPNEYIQSDWINENTTLNVVKRNDFKSDSNASGYDLITVDSKLKIQSKLRADKLHIEQTRRKSKKNNLSSDTGHVRYSVGEADVYVFSRPQIDDYLNIKKWNYIVIPEWELIDSENTGYLIPRVPKKIWGRYVGKSVETLENEYLRKKGV
jgi:hypothetical protein